MRLLGASIGLSLPLAASVVLYWALRLGPPRPTVIGLLLSGAAVGIIVGPFVGAARAPRVVQEGRPLRSAVVAAVTASAGGVLAFGVLVVLFETLNATLDLGGWPLATVQAYLTLFLPALLGAFVFALPFAIVAVVILRRLARVGLARSKVTMIAAGLLLAGGVTGFDAARTLPPPDPAARVGLHIVAINSTPVDTGVETGFQSGAMTTWASIPACKVTRIDSEVDGDWELRVMTNAEFNDWPRPIPPSDISAAYLPRNLDPATVTIDITFSHVDVHAGVPSQPPTAGTCANP
jgi:hypothetical protein